MSPAESNRRRALLAEMRSVSATDPARCEDLCFEALFGLPADLQRSLPATLLAGCLDRFERRWPGAGWARAQLADPTRPEVDFNRAARALGSDNYADGRFLDGLMYLTIAAGNEEPSTWVLSATRAASRAHAASAWEDADPAGAQELEVALGAWRRSGDAILRGEQYTEELPPTNFPERHPVFVAALARAWQTAIDYLTNRQIWTFRDPDPDLLAREIAEWRLTRE